MVCAIEAEYSRYLATHWYTCMGKPVMPSVLIHNAPVPRGGQTLACGKRWVPMKLKKSVFSSSFKVKKMGLYQVFGIIESALMRLKKILCSI